LLFASIFKVEERIRILLFSGREILNLLPFPQPYTFLVLKRTAAKSNIQDYRSNRHKSGNQWKGPFIFSVIFYYSFFITGLAPSINWYSSPSGRRSVNVNAADITSTPDISFRSIWNNRGTHLIRGKK